MKLTIDRAAAALALLIILGGYLLVYRPLEATIAVRYGQLDDARSALDRRADVAGQLVDLDAEERRERRWLGLAGTRSESTVLVDHFLRALGTLPSSEHVAITTVAAEPPTRQVAAAGDLFDEIPLTVALHGHYRDVLHVVRDLNRLDLAARIHIDLIANAGPASTLEPDLRATLRVTLLHEATHLATTPRHAST